MFKIEDITNKILCGDNLDVAKNIPSNSISALVTDPPYGLGFMGKDWDTFKTKYIDGQFQGRGHANPKRQGRSMYAGEYDFSRNPEFQQWFTVWAKTMLRITKPGGFLLCFGGTRTYHRLACAIEDAGWEIRDCMMWLYGSGFPKSHNISKAIDKAKGVERKVVGSKIGAIGTIGPTGNQLMRPDGKDKNGSRACSKYAPGVVSVSGEIPITAPATDLAQLWDGYGTALKPAWEPIIVAMKPLDGTFAHNAEAHGVAGLNIDAARIQANDQKQLEKNWDRTQSIAAEEGRNAMHGGLKAIDLSDRKSQGRWPANLILDEESAAMLDKQTGRLTSGGGIKVGKRKKQSTNFTASKNYDKVVFTPDSGDASRFFYCAKASRKERNMGMENCEDKLLARSGGAQGAENRGEKEYLQKHIGLNRVAVVKNNHPTVKPLALMKYLCTLLKMPGSDQIILDPFLGSGTTGIACKELGINFIGIEKEREYCEISVKRIAAVEGQEITLETTLPVTKNVEMFRTPKAFAGIGRRPNENLPHVSEDRQRIINAASAELRRNRN